MRTKTNLRNAAQSRRVGARIRRLRIESGLSQTELAAPHYTAAYISHIEKGRRTPSHEALSHIAGRLGVAVEHLITGRDPDADLRLQLQIDRAIAEVHSGALKGPARQLEQARDEAANWGISQLVARAEEALALVAHRQGRWERALEHLGAAEAAISSRSPEDRTSIVTLRSRCLFAMGRINHAIHVLEAHLIELHDSSPADPTALLQVYSALIGPYFDAGLKDRAIDAAEEAHRLESEVHDPEHLACMKINRAQILLDQDHRQAATRCLAQAEDLFREIGWRDATAKAAVARATAALETGDLETAEQRARAALVELEESPSVIDRVRILNLLGRIARLSGDLDAALDHLGEALSLPEQDDAAGLERAWARREVGLCHRDRSDPEGAVKHFQDALELYNEAEAPTQVATTARLLGDVLSELGRDRDALAAYRLGVSAVEDLA